MKVTIFSQISIDGKLTLGNKSSSKELFTLLDGEDIRFIHDFRGQVDAIIVGRRTVSTDNPSLTNRYGGSSPVRVVPSESLEFPDTCNVLSSPEPTIVVTTRKASGTNRARKIRKAGKEVLDIGEETVKFSIMLKELERRGMQHVMVEGGGDVNWQMLDAGLVDEIILMQLPIIIGGFDNVSLADGTGYRDIEMVKKFRLQEAAPKSNYLLLRFAKVA